MLSIHTSTYSKNIDVVNGSVGEHAEISITRLSQHPEHFYGATLNILCNDLGLKYSKSVGTIIQKMINDQFVEMLLIGP